MKMILVSAVLLCAAGVTQAETFTLTSTSKALQSINVPTGAGTSSGAGFNEFTSQVTFASGRKATTKGNCAGWNAPASSGFTTEGVCKWTEGNDEATMQFSCAEDMKTNTADCWGGMRGGATGRYAGKTGTISWHEKFSPDTNTGTAVGTGMWND